MFGKQVHTDPYDTQRVHEWARGMGIVVSQPMLLKWDPGHRYYQVCLFDPESVRDFWTRPAIDKPVPKLNDFGTFWRDDHILIIEDAS